MSDRLNSEICRIGLYDADISKVAFHINSPFDYVDAVARTLSFILNRVGYSKSSQRKYVGELSFHYDHDSISRVVIMQGKNKIVSFHIPFDLILLSPGFRFEIHGIEINTYVLAKLYEISECLRNQMKSVKKRAVIPTVESARNELENDEDQAGIEPYIYDIYSHILYSEPCYLRYDWDVTHRKGIKHPEYHIDINFSKRGTYKYGLYDSLLVEDFERNFDKEEDKMFLHKYHSAVPSLFSPQKIAKKRNAIGITNRKRKRKHRR